MCGIAGFLHFEQSREADRKTLQRITDLLAHRGPDAGGYFIDGPLALGHRRLSIIDLSSNANQPMHNRDKSATIVFNGEIYNYIELREELKTFGFQFSTESDTEVILQAYKKWGIDCVTKFNGMWALALWDQEKRILWLSRDRLGKKPLYYAQYDSSIIFPSELKSILSFGVPRRIRTGLLDLYLSFSCIPSPYTFFAGIYKLEAAHNMVISSDGTLTDRAFWDLPCIDEHSMITDKQLVYNTFDKLLTSATQIRMRSDAPYGAFLSGGLDSSSLVALMTKNSQHPIKTFTIGFDNKFYDERPLARTIAKMFKTEHQELVVEPYTLDQLLDLVTDYFDEPFGDVSAIPTGYVSQMASQKVKMAITGDGGDEVLSGYPSYQAESISTVYQRMPGMFQKFLPLIANTVSPLFPESLGLNWNRFARLLATSGMDFNSRLISKTAFIERDKIKGLLRGIKQEVSAEDYVCEVLRSCSFKNTFYKLMYAHYKIILSEVYLAKVDRMSMANSLETRSPFLDFRLVEFMAGVHHNVKMENLERKSILKGTIGKLLPKELLKKPKRGFSVPLDQWFRMNSVNSQMINKLSPLAKIGVDNEMLMAILNDNLTRKQDYGKFVWMLSVLRQVCKRDV